MGRFKTPPEFKMQMCIQATIPFYYKIVQPVFLLTCAGRLPYVFTLWRIYKMTTLHWVRPCVKNEWWCILHRIFIIFWSNVAQKFLLVCQSAFSAHQNPILLCLLYEYAYFATLNLSLLIFSYQSHQLLIQLKNQLVYLRTTYSILLAIRTPIST